MGPSSPVRWPCFRAPRGFSLSLLANGKRLLSWEQQELTLREVPGGKDLHRLPGRAENVLAVAPDGRRVLLLGRRPGVGAIVRDLESGAELSTLSSAVAFTTAVFLPLMGNPVPPGEKGANAVGGQVLSGGMDGTLRLWDAATGKELRLFAGTHMGIRSLAVSRDGKQALSCGIFGALRLWDVARGEEVRLFTGHRGHVNSVSLSPDGRLALSAGSDATIRLWDVNTGKELRRLPGHTGQVFGAVFTADGQHAVSWGTSDTFILWEVPGGRKLYTSGPLQGASIMAVSSPAGPGAALAAWHAQDGLIHLWQVPDPTAAGLAGPAGNMGELVVDLDGLPGSVLVRPLTPAPLPRGRGEPKVPLSPRERGVPLRAKSCRL